MTGEIITEEGVGVVMATGTITVRQFCYVLPIKGIGGGKEYNFTPFNAHTR